MGTDRLAGCTDRGPCLPARLRCTRVSRSGEVGAVRRWTLGSPTWAQWLRSRALSWGAWRSRSRREASVSSRPARRSSATPCSRPRLSVCPGQAGQRSVLPAASIPEPGRADQLRPHTHPSPPLNLLPLYTEPWLALCLACSSPKHPHNLTLSHLSTAHVASSLRLAVIIPCAVLTLHPLLPFPPADMCIFFSPPSGTFHEGENFPVSLLLCPQQLGYRCSGYSHSSNK